MTSPRAAPRVCLAVVALGYSSRLERCLRSLIGHESRHAFSIVCVVNPHPDPGESTRFEIDRAIEVLEPAYNLGWAGGLQLARTRTSAEFLVWVQDDMEVASGWLDALMDAAVAHPDIAAVGSHMIDEFGRTDGYNGGAAEPPGAVREWNRTDTTRERPVAAFERHDWVTSKGMLTRLDAFDAIGGPDPTLYPLNHVDKDYCTHLRAHGYGVGLAGAARLRHAGSQSAPSAFRRFLEEWREPRFDAQWSGPAARLAASPGPVEHDCAQWRGDGTVMNSVERAVGVEASRMLVAFARWASRVEERPGPEKVDEMREIRDRIAAFAEIRRDQVRRQ